MRVPRLRVGLASVLPGDRGSRSPGCVTESNQSVIIVKKGEGIIMAIIGKCQYTKDGKLVPPRERDIERVKSGMLVDMTGESGDRLTTDLGHTHIFLLETSGRSPQQAKQRSEDKLQRFFDRVDFLDGFRKIDVNRRTGYTPLNKNYQVTYEILYAMEGASRARNTVSPYEGQKRGGQGADPRAVGMYEFN